MEHLPIVLLAIAVAAITWVRLKAFFRGVTSDIASLTPAGREKLFREFNSILEQYNPFYKSLSGDGRARFIKRCISFIGYKTFIGMDGLIVTTQMKVRIAATAVQISYGLKKSSFRHYRVIKIFPESFYSRIHDRYIKGGASTSGVLFFSWKDFEEGYSDPSDRYNLGLHEIAHAMRFELLHGSDFDERFADYTDKWLEIAKPEFEAMNAGKTSFLRSYAGVNIEEFFAVCIEHFFEVPSEFKKHLPDIYNHLCFLLNLDPTRPEDDYRLDNRFRASINRDKKMKPIPEIIPRNYRYDNWHWSFTLILLGLFAALPAILYLQTKILYTPKHIILMMGVMVVLLTSLHKFFFSKGIYYFLHLIFFSLTAGLGGVLCMLLINLWIITGYSTQTYKVIDNSITRIDTGKGILLHLENEAYDKNRKLRLFEFGIPEIDSLEVTVSHGIFGIDNLQSRRIIFSH